MDIDAREERIRAIHDTLVETYGPAADPKEMTGTDYLIETILSQNTNDEARDDAFSTLMRRYDSYEAIETAPTEDIADAVRVCGLGPTKAERIQHALETIRNHTGGTYSMDFIDEMSLDDAMSWLTDIKGIGPKTAAVILCFHFKKPIMPVDTHVERITKRFRLVPHDASASKVQSLLNERVPDDIKYSFHILLIEHGRAACTARNPSCDETPLREYCEYYHTVIDGETDPNEYPT